MKIIGITKKNTPCMWTCIGKGIEGLGKYVDIPVIMYDQEDIKQLQPDNDEIILIFQAGNFRCEGWNLRKVKKCFPNSKIIPLGADTNIFLFIHNRHELDYKLVDLYLDLDIRCIEHYGNLGIKVDQWMWTTSDWFLNYVKNFSLNNKYEKEYDFIGVYHPGTLNHGYRKEMLEFIKNKRYKFTNGGGNGHEDNDLDRLLSYYAKSYISLGTTSHGIDNFRTLKGFRDWIGMYLDCPLIYDNWEMVKNCYNDNVIYYDYNNFQTIIDSFKLLQNNDLRKEYLNKQKEWIVNNTIDKQLLKLLIKHNFISRNQLCTSQIENTDFLD